MVQTQPIEKMTYQDGWLARFCLWLLSYRIARMTGRGSDRQGYDRFVDVSLGLMQGSADMQRDQVGVLLRSLVPAPLLWAIRTLFSPTRWVCESNAWFASRLFGWLIGPCDRIEVEVPDKLGQMQTQRSGVQIQKCRYLESAGCVGACINLCKMPTQEFFTEGFGIPFTMQPNFEDMSCKMIFGQHPPALEAEAIYRQPCLTNECKLASPPSNLSNACPRVEGRAVH